MRSSSHLRHHIQMRTADLPTARPTCLNVDNHRHAEATFLRHPIAHLLPDQDETSTTTTRRQQQHQNLSITGFSVDGPSPVREYQPVVHRLRLSASPYAPPCPRCISLFVEVLVIRRTAFSPVFRSSCLHSHSCGVHD